MLTLTTTTSISDLDPTTVGLIAIGFLAGAIVGRIAPPPPNPANFQKVKAVLAVILGVLAIALGALRADILGWAGLACGTTAIALVLIDAVQTRGYRHRRS
jgi:hypothetical protein